MILPVLISLSTLRKAELQLLCRAHAADSMVPSSADAATQRWDLSSNSGSGATTLLPPAPGNHCPLCQERNIHQQNLLRIQHFGLGKTGLEAFK